MKKYDKYDVETIERMIDGKLPWPELRLILSEEKDNDRFEKVMEIMQKRVSWKEKILLPLHEHLYIVSKEGKRIVKCDCGYEFGDYRENWKTKCRVRVRDTNESLDEIYPPYMHSDPEWEEIREYYCPGCLALLDTELAPPRLSSGIQFPPRYRRFLRGMAGKARSR